MRHSFTLTWEGQDRILRGDAFVPGSTFVPKEKSKAGVLLVAHGYKGFKDWGMFPYVGKQLAERSGLLTLTINFTYNGVGPSLDRFDEPERFAVNTYQREQEDIDVLFNWIRSEKFGQWIISEGIEYDVLPNTPIYLLGHSRGGATCLLYALDHPHAVNGVISWNGVTNMDLFTEQQKQEMRQSGRSAVINARTKEALPLDRAMLEDLEANVERYALTERIKDADFPLILVQGSDDLPGFREGSAKLVQNYAGAKWITINGAGHTFNTVHPFQGTTPALEAAIEATVEWLHHYVSGQPARNDSTT
ncbi:alpha/beta fold hydrolase [Paenibacillus alvei]|uniref:alpha/beta hydrolase family protein n=1 Tax=Paenibacillus alvei TaxID=44250 RepID=UPI003D292FB3